MFSANYTKITVWIDSFISSVHSANIFIYVQGKMYIIKYLFKLNRYFYNFIYYYYVYAMLVLIT